MFSAWEALNNLFTSPEWLRVVLGLILLLYITRLSFRPPFYGGLVAIPLVLIARDILLHLYPEHAVLLLSEAVVLAIFSMWTASYRRRWWDYLPSAVLVPAAAVAAAFRLTAGDLLFWQFVHAALLIAGYIVLFAQMYQISSANTAGGEFIERNRSGFLTFYAYLLAAVIVIPYGWTLQQALILPLTYGFHGFVFWLLHQEARRRSNLSLSFIRKHLYSTFDFIRTLNEALSERTAVQQVLDFVSRSVVESTYADGGALLLIRPGDNSLEMRSIEGYYPPPFPIPEITTQRIGKVQEYLKSTPIALGHTPLGQVARDRTPLFIRQAESDARLEMQNADRYTFTSSLIALPLISSDHLYGVLTVAKRTPGDWFSREDYDLCGVFADYTSMTIETLYNYSELIEKREIEREVGFAAQIQKDLLPARLPRVRGVDIAAESYPARGVSGDYYDTLPLKRIGKMGVLVCDVAGKGIPASLVMVMIRTVLHLIAGQTGAAEKVVRIINRSVTGNVSVDRFATLSYLLFDPGTGSIELSNAAHHPLLIYRAASATFEQVDTEGLPIGMEPDAQYTKTTRTMNSGDVAVLYSDGITEAMNSRSRQFGEERLKEAIADAAANGAESKDIMDSVFHHIKRFVGDAAQHDDMTLVVFRKR